MLVCRKMTNNCTKSLLCLEHYLFFSTFFVIVFIKDSKKTYKTITDIHEQLTKLEISLLEVNNKRRSDNTELFQLQSTPITF